MGIIVYEIALFAVVLAFLRGGSIRRLQETEFRHSLLIISCFLVQVTAMFLYDRIYFFHQTFPIWIASTYLALVYCCWQNRRLPGFLIFGAGLLLNVAVIVLNDGRMPVSVDALEWANLTEYVAPLQEGMTKHQPLTGAAVLPFLADVIPLKPPYALASRVVSVGDILMAIGISRFLYIRLLDSSQK